MAERFIPTPNPLEPVWSVKDREWIIESVVECAGERDGVTFWRIFASDGYGNSAPMVVYLSDGGAEWLEANTDDSAERDEEENPYPFVPWMPDAPRTEYDQ